MGRWSRCHSFVLWMVLLFSRPQLAVEGAVLNGFGDVVAGDFFGAGQVGDGAGDFQDAVVGARA